MKKIVAIILQGLFVLILAQCNQKNKSNLIGVWKLQQMEINGTKLQGSSLGNWMWEFNEEGGYLSDIAGAKEKGMYKLSGVNLIIKPVGAEKWPERSFTISKLDSSELRLVANGEKNKSSMWFIRVKADAVGEKD
jgi:hypothetical protein